MQSPVLAYARRALAAALVFVPLLAGALPARAETTIYGHFTFSDGDTATRAAYYGATRMRASMFDGNEAIYDAKSRELIFLDHDRKRFWKGPLAQANAIIDSLTMERDMAFWEAKQENQMEWMKFTEKFNESIESGPLDEERKIAGYKCKGWEISAGKNLVHTRWICEDLRVPDYTKDMQKALLLPALDPVGRSMGRILLETRIAAEGTILGSTTKVDTPTRKTTVSWKAIRVDSSPIPENVWEIPEGYVEITFQAPPAGK